MNNLPGYNWWLDGPLSPLEGVFILCVSLSAPLPGKKGEREGVKDSGHVARVFCVFMVQLGCTKLTKIDSIFSSHNSQYFRVSHLNFQKR